MQNEMQTHQMKPIANQACQTSLCSNAVLVADMSQRLISESLLRTSNAGKGSIDGNHFVGATLQKNLVESCWLQLRR
jgi:hypothetical protein